LDDVSSRTTNHKTSLGRDAIQARAPTIAASLDGTPDADVSMIALDGDSGRKG